MLKRAAIGAVSLSAAIALAAEWLRAPGWILAAGLVLAAASALYAARGSRTEGWSWWVTVWSGALTVVLLAVVALAATRRLRQVERHPELVREALVTDATRRLGGELDGAWLLARNLVDRAVAV